VPDPRPAADRPVWALLPECRPKLGSKVRPGDGVPSHYCREGDAHWTPAAEWLQRERGVA
jgi:hypothetical protein